MADSRFPGAGIEIFGSSGMGDLKVGECICVGGGVVQGSRV